MGAKHLERHAHLNSALASPRWLLAAVSVTGVLALLLAAVLQHRFDFQPCPWCVLQRLLVLVVVLLAALGAALPVAGLPMVAAGFALVVSAAGITVAFYQHWVAARSPSCDLTLADRIIGTLGLADHWPALFEATARCDEADIDWLGVPFSLWGAVLFAFLLAGAMLALRVGSHRTEVVIAGPQFGTRIDR